MNNYALTMAILGFGLLASVFAFAVYGLFLAMHAAINSGFAYIVMTIPVLILVLITFVLVIISPFLIYKYYTDHEIKSGDSEGKTLDA